MRILALAPIAVLALVGGGCGESSTSGAAARTESNAAPAAVVAEAPALPRELRSCRLEPARTVVRDRGTPQVVVGGDSVAFIHHARHRLDPSTGRCDAPSAIHSSPLALTGDAIVARSAKAPCVVGLLAEDPDAASPQAGGVLFAEVVRDGGDLYAGECTYHSSDVEQGTGAAVCFVTKFGGEPLVPVARADGVTIGEARFGLAFAKVGETRVFTFALGNTDDGGGVFALLDSPDGARASERLGRPPSAVDLDDPSRFVMTASRDATDRIAIEHGIPTQTRRIRTVIGQGGLTETFPTAVTLDALPVVALDTTTDRSVAGRPPSIRLVQGGVASPIGGVDPAVATFGSDFAELGDRILVSWSEGTGRTTRIRLALVDRTSKAIVGPIVEVSTAGIEAGYSSVDALGDEAVIAWDEKVGSAWEVRAARIRCE